MTVQRTLSSLSSNKYYLLSSLLKNGRTGMHEPHQAFVSLCSPLVSDRPYYIGYRAERKDSKLC